MIDRGLYHVNGVFYKDKIEALLKANETKADVRWYFHQEELEQYDWTKEPNIDLLDLYSLRAQQIRDNYDYVVVMCSGGSDSTNVIFSFLDNNIFVDEVVASAPVSGLQNWSFNNQDRRVTNFISETKYAQFPLMDKIKNASPKTKTTLNDYFPLLINVEADRWTYQLSDAVHPSAVGHFSLELLDHIKQIADSGKSIAVVYGTEKPFLVRNRGEIYYSIVDVSLNLLQQPFKYNYPNVHVIPFYITMDMPQLMIKQAHVLSRWLFKDNNQSALSYVCDAMQDQHLTATQRRRKYSAYDRAIRECIYPSTFDNSLFQTDKLSFTFYADMDYWFYSLHGESKQHKSMLSEFNVFCKQFDKKYFNNDQTGFVVLGNSYCIGQESFFCNSI